MYNFEIEFSKEDRADWYKNEPYLQSKFWAEFKSLHGWKPYRFDVKFSLKTENQKENNFTVSVLVRKFAKIFHLAYIPMGITLQKENSIIQDYKSDEYLTLLDEFSKKIKKFLPKNTICIRFDSPIDFETPSERDEFVKNKFPFGSIQKNKVDIQPPDTTTLDLSKSEDEILANMKSKWRYNINLASKKGVVIEKATSKEIDIFYDLYLETAKRDGIAIHSKKYYQDLLELSEKKERENSPLVSLYVAKHEDDVLASIITLFMPYQAVYVYGASCNIKRNLMPAYLLQWTAIKDAKNFGSQIYDFYGMPPTDDENHPMHGLYRFKTGFGGKNVHRVGSLDVPISWIYTPYKIAENLRSFWYKTVKKKLAGR